MLVGCCCTLQCGFPVRPRLRLVLPPGVDIITTVWLNNLNQTMAVDVSELELPALLPLAEASVTDTEQCNTACDWRYHVSGWMVAMRMHALAP